MKTTDNFYSDKAMSKAKQEMDLIEEYEKWKYQQRIDKAREKYAKCINCPYGSWQQTIIFCMFPKCFKERD